MDPKDPLAGKAHRAIEDAMDWLAGMERTDGTDGMD